MRWVFKFSFELEHRVKPHLKKVSDSWRVDETYVKVKGKWVYLFRAIDKHGQTIDFYLSRTRDYKAAEKFFKKIICSRSASIPRVVNV
ncbi:MAG: IS6 family transposase, partial [Candidatus Marinamargulisbacteria bacterium]